MVCEDCEEDIEDDEDYEEDEKSPLAMMCYDVIGDIDDSIKDFDQKNRIEFLQKRLETVDKILEEKYKETLETDEEKYKTDSKQLEDLINSINSCISRISESKGIKIFKNLYIKPDNRLIKVAISTDTILMEDFIDCISDNIRFIVHNEILPYYMFIGDNSTYIISVIKPNKPIEFNELKEYVKNKIEDEIYEEERYKRKNDMFNKRIDELLDNKFFQGLRNEQQKLFFIMHKYNLDRKGAKELNDHVSSVKAMMH